MFTIYMKDTIVPDPEKLEKIKKAIAAQDSDNFHVLADFDGTFTKAFAEGKKIQKSVAQVRNGNYLSPEYVAKAHALFEIYHPIEISDVLSRKEKAEKMQEWWIAHLLLLKEHGFKKQVAEDIAAKKSMLFRQGALEFIDLLHEKNIPLVIMSAGLGDVFKERLAAEGRLYHNVYLISNFFEFDGTGRAISIPEPIIHSMNKHETAIRDFPSFEAIKDRKNVLLMGDLVEDVGMVEGFGYDNLIKIGFLNEKIDENMQKFKENFDVIIPDDGEMNYVHALVKELFG